jgi:uncharacterized membrane protein
MFEEGGQIQAKTPYIETIIPANGASIYWLVLSWLSLAVESYFVLDWIVRVFAWGTRFLTSFWNFFDSLIVLGLVPAKLLLPTRLTLIVAIAVLLRTWRICRAIKYIRRADKEASDFIIMEVIKERDARLEEERERAAIERARLSMANHKLEKLLG